MTVNAGLLVEYRCRAKGCLLLRVWQTPNGLELLAPSSQGSDRVTAYHLERLAAEGVAIRGESVPIDDYPPWVLLACDHVLETVRESTITEDAAAGRPGNPTRILWSLSDTDGH